MTLYEDVKLLLKKNGVEVKSDEEEIFKMEVDGILEDVRDITNNDFYERWSSHLSLLNQKVCRRCPRVLSTT